MLFEKGDLKDYFVSANFVKRAGLAEVLSVPRARKAIVCSQLAKAENQCPLAFLSFIQTQVMEILREKPSCSASTTTTEEKHHPSVGILSKSRHSISREHNYCFTHKTEQDVLQTGQSVLIPAEVHTIGHIFI